MTGADRPASSPDLLEGQDERHARALLTAIWEPGDIPFGQRVAEIGAVRVVAELRDGSLPRTSTARQGLAADRARVINVAELLDAAARRGIRFVIPGDAEWPDSLGVLDMVSLDNMGGQPYGLWLRGPLDLAETLRRSVSVVGARAASAYGEHVATDVAAGLADRGVAVMSGAAYGIDSAAHRGALAVGGATIAVLACGVDVIYPRGNASLLGRVADEGLIVSEAAPGATPTRPRFLIRNRIIAAATPGTVVVEATPRSGALNTANWADKCSRQVMGVPGPVTSSLSAGVHERIRSSATLVTSSAEILELIGPIGTDTAPVPRGPERPRDGLPSAAVTVLEAMPSRGCVTVDELCATTPIAPRECIAALGLLMARGLVQSSPTGWSLTRLARTGG